MGGRRGRRFGAVHLPTEFWSGASARLGRCYEAQPVTSELSAQQLNHHFLLDSCWLLSCSAVDVVFDVSDALLASV